MILWLLSTFLFELIALTAAVVAYYVLVRGQSLSATLRQVARTLSRLDGVLRVDCQQDGETGKQEASAAAGRPSEGGDVARKAEATAVEPPAQPAQEEQKSQQESGPCVSGEAVAEAVVDPVVEAPAAATLLPADVPTATTAPSSQTMPPRERSVTTATSASSNVASCEGVAEQTAAAPTEKKPFGLAAPVPANDQTVLDLATPLPVPFSTASFSADSSLAHSSTAAPPVASQGKSTRPTETLGEGFGDTLADALGGPLSFAACLSTGPAGPAGPQSQVSAQVRTGTHSLAHSFARGSQTAPAHGEVCLLGAPPASSPPGSAVLPSVLPSGAVCGTPSAQASTQVSAHASGSGSPVASALGFGPTPGLPRAPPLPATMTPMLAPVATPILTQSLPPMLAASTTTASPAAGTVDSRGSRAAGNNGNDGRGTISTTAPPRISECDLLQAVDACLARCHNEYTATFDAASKKLSNPHTIVYDIAPGVAEQSLPAYVASRPAVADRLEQALSAMVLASVRVGRLHNTSALLLILRGIAGREPGPDLLGSLTRVLTSKNKHVDCLRLRQQFAPAVVCSTPARSVWSCWLKCSYAAGAPTAFVESMFHELCTRAEPTCKDVRVMYDLFRAQPGSECRLRELSSDFAFSADAIASAPHTGPRRAPTAALSRLLGLLPSRGAGAAGAGAPLSHGPPHGAPRGPPRGPPHGPPNGPPSGAPHGPPHGAPRLGVAPPPALAPLTASPGMAPLGALPTAAGFGPPIGPPLAFVSMPQGPWAI